MKSRTLSTFFTLRTRLIGGIGIMIALAMFCGTISIVVANQAVENTEAANGPIAERSAAEDAYSSMLVARELEVSFLLTRDLDLVGKFDQQIEKIITKLDWIQETTESEEWAKNIRLASEGVVEYKDIFHTLVAYSTERGLSEKEGLEGELRNAVHTVEGSLKDSGYDQLTVLMLMCRRHEKDYLLRGNREKYLGRIDQRLSEFDAAVVALGIPKEQADVWAANWAVYRSAIHKLADANDRIAETRASFDQTMHEVEGALDQILATAPEIDTSKFDQAKVFSEITLAGVLVVGVGVAFLLIRSITGPIRAVAGWAEKLAQGDLSVEELTYESKDEIGRLHNAMSLMQQSTHEIVSAIREASQEMSDTTRSVIESADQTVQGMDRQSQLVEQVSAAVIELNASSEEVTKKTEQAADHATSSGASADQGGQIVESTIEGMKEIHEAVSSGSESVSKLGERSEQISEMISVINDIADQTNLLALNAAIEAARAGEHGRGFAVVADEVRKLADRTTQATQEVTDSITAIREGTDQAVHQMKIGTERVAQGVERTQAAGKSLGEIQSFASELEDMVRSIAASAEEQSTASNDVSRSIEEISGVTNEAVENARASSTAMGELEHRTEELVNLTTKFVL